MSDDKAIRQRCKAAPAAPETQRVDADNIRAQARAEAPATYCRGCNHERHPSLACGECERAGHVCTGLATHRSVVTAPAAQVGLPAAEVVVTTEHASEWSFGEIIYQPVTQSLAIPSRAKLIAAVEADIRANLSRVQAEHAREREADRRRIEELEANEVELRAMVSGAQRERDFEHGNWFEASHLATLNGKHAAMASERLAEARKEQAKEFERAENLTAENADLRRQLGEARAEVADLLPRLDAAALENTQLGRERDGARNELATLREDFARVRRERDEALTKHTNRHVEALAAERDLRDLRVKVDELESGARVARLVEANRQLKAKVERRTGLVEQALEGRRSNWTPSQWFDWEHTALAELATAQPAVCPKCGYPKEPTGDPQTHRLCDCPNDQPAEAQETRKP